MVVALQDTFWGKSFIHSPSISEGPEVWAAFQVWGPFGGKGGGSPCFHREVGAQAGAVS